LPDLIYFFILANSVLENVHSPEKEENTNKNVYRFCNPGVIEFNVLKMLRENITELDSIVGQMYMSLQGKLA